MSCGCINRKLDSDYARVRALAKKLAVIEGEEVGIYSKKGGGYGFATLPTIPEKDRPIIEYITPY